MTWIVNWVDHSKTLREQGIDENETVLLRRKYFFSDGNVDSRDPVQLNLLFVQARDSILNGTHPVTLDKACEFAGIQCQAQFGDYIESKHKPGFLESVVARLLLPLIDWVFHNLFFLFIGLAWKNFYRSRTWKWKASRRRSLASTRNTTVWWNLNRKWPTSRRPVLWALTVSPSFWSRYHQSIIDCLVFLFHS